jgi:hypothetical protein
MLPVEEITNIARLYRGELLPCFYEDWVLPERDRFQAAYHQKMNILLERLIQEECWNDALVWAEQWIRLDYAPALQNADAGACRLWGSGWPAVYQRCVESHERDLGLEPLPKPGNCSSKSGKENSIPGKTFQKALPAVEPPPAFLMRYWLKSKGRLLSPVSELQLEEFSILLWRRGREWYYYWRAQR